MTLDFDLSQYNTGQKIFLAVVIIGFACTFICSCLSFSEQEIVCSSKYSPCKSYLTNSLGWKKVEKTSFSPNNITSVNVDNYKIQVRYSNSDSITDTIRKSNDSGIRYRVKLFTRDNKDINIGKVFSSEAKCISLC